MNKNFQDAPEGWSGPYLDCYIKERTKDKNGTILNFKTFAEAVEKANTLDKSVCSGITKTARFYQLRVKNNIIKGTMKRYDAEATWVRGVPIFDDDISIEEHTSPLNLHSSLPTKNVDVVTQLNEKKKSNKKQLIDKSETCKKKKIKIKTSGKKYKNSTPDSKTINMKNELDRMENILNRYEYMSDRMENILNKFQNISDRMDKFNGNDISLVKPKYIDENSWSLNGIILKVILFGCIVYGILLSTIYFKNNQEIILIDN